MIRISRISVALIVAILIVSVVIYSGYQHEIQKRLFSVGGQLSLRQYSTGSLYEEAPLDPKSDFLKKLKALPEVAHVQSFAFKPALVSNEKEVAGIVLKGLDPDFNLEAFSVNLKTPAAKVPGEGEIWVSEKQARTLELKMGSELVLFFLQEPPRYRKMKVTRIFQSGLEEVDETFSFVSMDLIREMNDWKGGEVGGFEVFVKDFARLEQSAEKVESEIPYNMGVESITQTHAQLFEWLEMIGRNVVVIFFLVAMVAGFNMAATLLIMVVERRKMVGVLKAMGAENALIRRIFVLNGVRIISQGILFGNGVGIGLALLQDHFKLIPLDPENYFVNTVPIGWDFPVLLGINVAVLLVSSLVILIPVRLVNRIQPAEAVRA